MERIFKTKIWFTWLIQLIQFHKTQRFWFGSESCKALTSSSSKSLINKKEANSSCEEEAKSCRNSRRRLRRRNPITVRGKEGKMGNQKLKWTGKKRRRCAPELKGTAPVSGRTFSVIPTSPISSATAPTSTSRSLSFFLSSFT